MKKVAIKLPFLFLQIIEDFSYLNTAPRLHYRSYVGQIVKTMN